MALLNALFWVKLRPMLATQASIDFATMDGSAKQNVDYAPSSGTLTFMPGVVRQPLFVPLLQELDALAGKEFTVVLSNPVGCFQSDVKVGTARFPMRPFDGHAHHTARPVLSIASNTTTDQPTNIGLLSTDWHDGLVSVQGQVTARNPASNDGAVWNVSFAAKVSAGVPAIMGAPTITAGPQDASMAACALTLGAQANGVFLMAQGLANTTILWSGTFIQTIG